MQRKKKKITLPHESVAAECYHCLFIGSSISSRRSCPSCRCGRVSRRSASMWRGPAVPQSARLLPLWMPNRLPVWLIPEDVCRYVGRRTRHHAAEVHMPHVLFFFCLLSPFALHCFFALSHQCTPSSSPTYSAAPDYYSAAAAVPPPHSAPAVATGPIASPAAEDSLLFCPCCCRRCSLCLWFTVLWLSW